MSLKLDALYSIRETTKFVDMSERTLQMYANKHDLQKIDNRYIFNGHQIKELMAKRNEKRTKKIVSLKNVSLQVEKINEEYNILKDKYDLLLLENGELNSKLSEEIPHQEKLKKAIELITIEAMRKGVQHKIFTDEEYQDIIGTITEVDFQKEQVQYLRGRVEKQDEVLNKLVKQVERRAFIEAKEKGFDKN